jgi:hypothetical protein
MLVSRTFDYGSCGLTINEKVTIQVTDRSVFWSVEASPHTYTLRWRDGELVLIHQYLTDNSQTYHTIRRRSK